MPNLAGDILIYLFIDPSTPWPEALAEFVKSKIFDGSPW